MVPRIEKPFGKNDSNSFSDRLLSTQLENNGSLQKVCRLITNRCGKVSSGLSVGCRVGFSRMTPLLYWSNKLPSSNRQTKIPFFEVGALFSEIPHLLLPTKDSSLINLKSIRAQSTALQAFPSLFSNYRRRQKRGMRVRGYKH